MRVFMLVLLLFIAAVGQAEEAAEWKPPSGDELPAFVSLYGKPTDFVPPDAPLPILRRYRAGNQSGNYETFTASWPTTPRDQRPLVQVEETDSIVFVGADQAEEEFLAEYRDLIVIWPGAEFVPKRAMMAKSIQHPGSLSPHIKNPFIALDALGEPIAEATVTIQEVNFGTKRRALEFTGFITDAQGRVPAIVVQNPNSSLRYEINHPEYGIASARRGSQSGETRFPVVRDDSKAAASAAKGVVLLPSGDPASGIRIGIAALGYGDHNHRVPWAVYGDHLAIDPHVLTNDKGEFRIYSQHPPRTGFEGSIHPTNTLYQLAVTPPTNSPLLPFEQVVSCREDSILRFPTGDRAYQILFEHHDGTQLPENIAETISLSLVVDEKYSATIHPRHHRSPLRLPYGKLRASHRAVPQLQFNENTLSEDSPERIVFREVAKTREARGRVVHAFTGDPISNALVLAAAHGPHDLGQLALLDHTKWDEMKASIQDGKLELDLREKVSFPATLSGPDGSFVLSVGSEVSIGGVTIGDQGFLLWQKSPNLVHHKSDIEGAEWGTFPLIPAAVCAVTIPNPDDSARQLSITVHEASSRSAILAIQKFMDNLGSPSGMWVQSPFRMLQPESEDILRFPVPANSEIQVAISNSPTSYHFPSIPPLAAGETRDLGRMEVTPATEVIVLVEDQQGEQIEGARVQYKSIYQGSENPYSIHHMSNAVTDAEGFARMWVSKEYPGTFGIMIPDPDHPNMPGIHVSIASTDFDYSIQSEEFPIVHIKLDEAATARLAGVAGGAGQ